jgi:predicted CoA-substrate-specific enzyme activase
VDNCEATILGIDVGSVSIAAVILDSNASVVHRQYLFHKGNIQGALAQVLRNLPIRQVDAFGVVAEKGREFFTAGIEVNEQVAIIEGVKRDCPEVRTILTIGGEHFGLILFDDRGRYKKYISNSACAAGTGSFLDQQAVRLGLSGSEELSRIAGEYEKEPPKIATRCAVFAQTDLIHIQQQGYSLSAIAAGLCRGVAQNICDTLMHGVNLRQPMVAVGGVGRNSKVIRYIEEEVGAVIRVPDNCETVGAVGASLVALEQNRAGVSPAISVDELLNTQEVTRVYFYPPLSESGREITDLSSRRSFISHEVEVDIYDELKGGSVYDCYLGIDIGSTSTKAVLMDEWKNVLVGMYTRTKGQPIAGFLMWTVRQSNPVPARMLTCFMNSSREESGQLFEDRSCLCPAL